jgi:hypothetical protein
MSSTNVKQEARRPVLLARGMVAGRDACRALAPQGHAAAEPLTRGPPRRGVALFGDARVACVAGPA